MNPFGSFFKHEEESLALIDIGSSSVAGAYANFKNGATPSVVFSKRVPIIAREGTSVAEDMERALTVLTDALIKEGAPELARATGSGAVSEVLASIGAPWQETSVRTEVIEKPKPFTFSHGLLEDALGAGVATKEGKSHQEQSVVATFLNGYETHSPLGKRATRADVTILSSSIDTVIADTVTAALRKAYHTHAVRLTAFAPVAYAVFRDVYPHEKDFLILDVSGGSSDLTFVKRGTLASFLSTPHGLLEMRRAEDNTILKDPSTGDPAAANAKAGWLKGISDALTIFAATHALPRTLFLLAEENTCVFIKGILDESPFRALWLSDEPLSVIPVLPEHFAPFVSTKGLASADVYLAMLALYARKGIDIGG